MWASLYERTNLLNSKPGEEQMQRPRSRKELYRLRVQKEGHCGWDIVNKGIVQEELEKGDTGQTM